MSWPKKVTSRTFNRFSYDDNDVAIVRNIAGPIRNGKILDRTGLASLISYLGSSNVRTLTGHMSSSFPGFCSAYNTAGAYPTSNGSTYTISCIIKDAPLGGDQMILASGGTPNWLLAVSGSTLLFQTSDGGVGRHTVNLNTTGTHFVSVKVTPATPEIAISVDGTP